MSAVSPGGYSAGDSASALSAVEVSGSLSLKEYSMLSGEYWTRRFFLLKGSQLFYYTDRAAFTEVGPITELSIITISTMMYL